MVTGIAKPKPRPRHVQQRISVALRVWLGIPIFNLPSDAKRCTSGAIIDKFGDHLLGCNQEQNLRMRRHNTLCEVVFNALLVDDSRCRREIRCSSTSNSRPGDIFYPNFKHGIPTYFDLTVRNSLQPSYLVQAGTCPGAAAAAGEIEKDQRHDAMVSNTGGIFHPLVVESLGLWTPNSLPVLKIIARRASCLNNAGISRSICNLHQQLSVKLWLYNAKMVLYRVALEGRVDPSWDL